MPPTARAFVPGHVTGFFSVHPDEDPLAAGSRGAGVALSDGVTVHVAADGPPAVEVNGDSADVAAVTNVLDRLGVTARVRCETPLPISAGFGVSGACALGTALAVDAATAGGWTEDQLAAIAHAAEVEAGTGLGDVVGQARGGLPIRLEPGPPPRGRLDGLPARPAIEYVTFGGLDTASVIGGDTEALSAAGERALADLREAPTVETFMSASRRFAREADLLPDRVAAAIDDVAAAGGEAAMAMLGETVFALDGGLTDAGYDARACRASEGAAVVEYDSRGPDPLSD
jgi:pantoate kinase